MNDTLCFLLLSLFFVSISFAGEADVMDVQVTSGNNNTFTFDVTVSHLDSGWEHYANKWEVLDEKGNILGTRILHHPHVNEQPFTRSLSGIQISKDIKVVIVRAHDSVHEYGGEEMSVNLP